MKIRNISRQSGGADIKLKDKMPRVRIVARAVFVSIIFVLAFFYLMDTLWNGAFVDWFTRNYMVTYMEYSEEFGEEIPVTKPEWGSLKVLILRLVLMAAVGGPVIVAAAAGIYAKIREKETIKDAGRMFQEYMNGDRDASEVFPEEYAEVAAQMTEIKAAMQRHEQIIRDEASRKNDLIAYLAHDLKTPLTSVIGYLSLLDEAPDMPEKQKEKYVKISLDKAVRLERLINEFFEITRYNLQQMELEEECIDLYYMLLQMADEFYPLLKSHENSISLRVDEDLTIYGDSEKLARVFNNILKNAIAYSYPDTAIEIWTQKAAGEIQIYFRNKGRTIPAQRLETIFDKFFRLDESRGTHTGGAGLGLAIAKEIVHLHGGKIWAASEKELTTFCVILPV